MAGSAVAREVYVAVRVDLDADGKAIGAEMDAGHNPETWARTEERWHPATAEEWGAAEGLLSELFARKGAH